MDKQFYTKLVYTNTVTYLYLVYTKTVTKCIVYTKFHSPLLLFPFCSALNPLMLSKLCMNINALFLMIFS